MKNTLWRNAVSLGAAPAISYALALAVLFGSPDKALDYWYGVMEGLPTKRKVQRTFGIDYWNSDAIFRLYVDHKGNYRSISDALAISPSYIRPQLISAGLPGLGLVDMPTTAKAILDFQKGMSLEAACEANGASIEEVEKLLRTGIAKLSTALTEILQSKFGKE